MQSLWNDDEAKSYGDDPVQLRVYTSRLLGQEPKLVLHGGGNTSVKTYQTNLFGEEEALLYVKGSGWDLATIEAAGFAPVRLDVLQKLATLPALSDSDMVKMQKSAMTDPGAPNPSIEAILHAIIPFQYVDHTHADAVITISNSKDGEQKIRDLYGDSILIVPYVMPGFILAKTVAELSRSADWTRLKGMILLNHGVFSFANDAKTSYVRMIEIVTQAEEYIASHIIGKNGGTPAATIPGKSRLNTKQLITLSEIRQHTSQLKGSAMIARLNAKPNAVAFSQADNLDQIAGQGPLTPDHIIRTKRTPVIVGQDVAAEINRYAEQYQAYFDRHNDGNLSCLDRAPRWAVWPGQGAIAFGSTVKEADIVADITDHTMDAIFTAEQLGGWRALPEKELFDIEYWELEQAKLKKKTSTPPLQGQIALVTGAASGIGKACVNKLRQHGAAVIALDIAEQIQTLFQGKDVLGVHCDITDKQSIVAALTAGVSAFGGLDILINNAGIFPVSEDLENLNTSTWERSLKINLTGHQMMLTHSIPFLRRGIKPSVIMMASKNVPAPGPGAAAYSVAKAGFTQLARVAALELAEYGIRVNILHPDAVFDTGIWTDEVLAKRAKHYGMSVQQYKTKNLLHVEITSEDVAELVCAIAGPAFSKTTGAQIPIDGGNDRVI
jgi:rhamnose utilization protein RhaD (predicted bifunctional aldolase and dehydrogenase)/NAD(P)-dependent dehydrogenase (short-subunit alcohol dehydrogenase family)